MIELHPERRHQLAIGAARLLELSALIAMEPEAPIRPSRSLYLQVLAEAVAITKETNRIKSHPVDGLIDPWRIRRDVYLKEKS